MTTLAIGIKKDKAPVLIQLCDSIEKAEAIGLASDFPDYTVCSPAKLGDVFSLAQLAELFNAIPGDEQVTRFSDKQSAVARIIRKAEGAREQMESPATKRKPRAKKEPGVRKPRKLDGKVKAISSGEMRWKEGTVRKQVFDLLCETGASPLEDFLELASKKLKLERAQALSAVHKLIAVKRAVVS